MRGDRGSAAVEFTLLAIPLFLPLFIYMNQFAELSGNEQIARTLARESVRGFIASKSDSSGYAVAHEIVRVGGQQLGLNADEINAIELSFTCSENPCLSPNGKVRATISMKMLHSTRTVVASAQEYVSPWT